MSSHPLQPYWELASAAIQVEAITTALRLGVFERLSEAAGTASVAVDLGLDVANTAHLLELLWSMGLLDRTGDVGQGELPAYAITVVSRTYFLTQSPLWVGDAWRYREARLRQAGSRLAGLVRDGRGESGAPDVAGQWAAAARGQLSQDQRAATVPAAWGILSGLPEFSSARRMLDLGGGPGWVAIELLRRQSKLTGVVFDYPEAVAVAAENILQAGLQDRLDVLGGEFPHAPIGEGYDLIWCSSVLHFVADLDAGLQCLWRALRPGGVLVSVHAEIPDSAGLARRVLPHYLPLLLQGRYVGRQGDLCERLARVGFTSLHSSVADGFPMAPLTVVIARKAEGC